MKISFVKVNRNRRKEGINSLSEGSSEKLLETCIICGAMTDVPINRPVSKRKWYVPGAGQMCRECCIRLYRTEDLRNLQSSDIDQLFLDSFRGAKENGE